MQAMVIDDFGGTDGLHLAEVESPILGPDEVLICVAATSVNPIDWKICNGALRSRFPHRFPLIPGWDACGTVADRGQNVAEFTIGQPVYALCRKPEVQWGTYAEYVCIPAKAVAPIPAGLSFAAAASLPLVGLTAWQALFDFSELQSGETALIHAAAGGVGSLAVQLAKWAGATVIATTRAENHDYVRALGADHVIDYAREDFVTAISRLTGDGVDVALSTVGGDVLPRSLQVLCPGGRLVSITGTPDQAAAAARGVKAGFVFVRPHGRQLRELTALVESGKLRPPAIAEMPLEHAAEALRRSQNGHVRGKIVLTILDHSPLSPTDIRQFS